MAHATGLPWGPAWVLRAAVAPTDATGARAGAAVLRQVQAVLDIEEVRLSRREVVD